MKSVFFSSCFVLFTVLPGSSQELWIITGHERLLAPVELGHVILVGDASLTIENVPEPGVRFRGNLWALGDSRITMTNSVIVFQSEYHGQYQLAAVERSHVSITGCSYRIPNEVQHGLVVANQAEIIVSDTDFGAVQLLSANQSSFSAKRLNGRFEVIVQDESSMTLEDIPRDGNSGEVWVWVEFPAESVASYTPPLPGFTQSWVFPPDNATGIEQRISLERCQTLLWPMLVRRDAHLTLKDIPEENWTVVGLYYPRSGRVSHLRNQMTRDYEQLDLSDRTIILDHASIDTWNLYGQGTAWLRVDDCLLGEILAMESSRLIMNRTTIDGTGGYFGASSESSVLASGCRFTCDVQVAQGATVEMNQCSLEPYESDPTGDYTFLRVFDQARVLLNQSPVSTTVIPGGDGLIGVTWLNDVPDHPPLPGESIVLTGTVSWISFNDLAAQGSWRCFVTPLPARYTKTGSSTAEYGIQELGRGTGNLNQGILGTWNDSVQGLDYLLQIQLIDGFGRIQNASWLISPGNIKNHSYPVHKDPKPFVRK